MDSPLEQVRKLCQLNEVTLDKKIFRSFSGFSLSFVRVDSNKCSVPDTDFPFAVMVPSP